MRAWLQSLQHRFHKWFHEDIHDKYCVCSDPFGDEYDD